MQKHLTQNVLGFGLIVLLALLLSGCGSVKKIEVSATPIEKPPLELPKADVLNLRDIKWVIITEDNFSKIIDDIKKKGRPLAIFGLTDEGYESLGLNFSDIRAFIQQQNAIIAAYESYYKDSTETFDKANKQIKETNKKIEDANKDLENQSFFKKLTSSKP